MVGAIGGAFLGSELFGPCPDGAFCEVGRFSHVTEILLMSAVGLMIGLVISLALRRLVPRLR